jgi:tripeptide aminopeptidase
MQSRCFRMALLVGCLAYAGIAEGQSVPDLQNAKIQQAVRVFTGRADALMAEHIRISEIPAPYEDEGARAAYMRDRFIELGLQDVHIDAAGNAVGRYPGREKGPGVCLAAHLDTVFPPETDVTVQKKDDRYYGPGMSDNGAGLIALISLIQALNTADITPRRDVLFIANVGEEGKGDLSGMRYLFGDSPLKKDIAYFVSIDGAGESGICNGAIGSRRYAVTFKGPGGHSWGSFGMANPLHAMSRAIDQFVTYQVPESPKTTFSVGTVSGGTSVNSIPFAVTIEVDMRSEDDEELRKIDAWFLECVQAGVDEEKAWAKPGRQLVEADIVLIGDRPSGMTPQNSFIARAAVASKKALGITSAFRTGSTDSNIPISLGIPAITVGSGGSGGGAHSTAEWYNPEGAERGLSALLLTMLTLAEGE